LDSSFETVSKQLADVYKSLGEMKELSTNVTSNVTSLNKILTNVKARGTWAELQLKSLLDQIIPGMYAENYSPRADADRVEFAIRIPSEDGSSETFLPLDSKFPREDYERLVSASELGDDAAVAEARKALARRIRDEGKRVVKYISPPETTPFAIMYLATEGLYAEAVSSSADIIEELQAKGIMVAGPTTVIALLNAFSLGFKSIAINRKANEVWEILGAAKAQYDKFGVLLDKAKKKVSEAGDVLDEAKSRNNIIQKKLKNVQSLSPSEAQDMLSSAETEENTYFG
jgi:DNA recombination protein RmuC